MKKKYKIFIVLGAVVSCWVMSSLAVRAETEILDRYRRALVIEQAFLTDELVRNASIFPNWINNHNRFWYRRSTNRGQQEFRLVDADKGTNLPAFDHVALATALSKVSGDTVDATRLPVTILDLEADPLKVTFNAYGKRWIFRGNGGELEEAYIPPSNWLISPDGTKAAFLRDYNLWVRDMDSGNERPLTYDGEQYHAYGMLPERANILGDMAIVNLEPFEPTPDAIWSPDSSKIFTQQTDERRVKLLPSMIYVPDDGSVRPRLVERKFALPEDEDIASYRMVVLDASTGDMTAAQYGNVPDSVLYPGMFGSGRAWWSADSKSAYFIDMTRGQKTARVVYFDMESGASEVLFEEKSDSYIDLNLDFELPAVLRPIPESNELLWFSERSGWAHVYLYDLETGALKNTVTSGSWLVRDILHFDAERREVFLQIAGRVKDRDPYLREVVRVNVDTGEMTLLVSGDHDYVVQRQGLMSVAVGMGFDLGATGNTAGISPNSEYFVTTRVRYDRAPVTELRDREGNLVMILEEADISGLPDHWRWPERVKLKAADGKTDIYGLVFRPTDFDPNKKYPVVDMGEVLPGWSAASKQAFSVDPQSGYTYMAAAAYAELGFVVVSIDGRGSAYRSKAFRDYAYGQLQKGSDLADHVAGIRQLAGRHLYMDVNRVGITDTGGMNGAVYGMLRFPDFYKVGVSTSVYDPRMVMQGEVYQGVLPATDYTPAVPGTLASNLKGRLLIIHGMLDLYYHVGGVMQLADALVKANKEFDLALLPTGGHAWNTQHYGLRRTWNYLVRHLQGVEPPVDFVVSSGLEHAQEQLESAKR